MLPSLLICPFKLDTKIAGSHVRTFLEKKKKENNCSQNQAQFCSLEVFLVSERLSDDEVCIEKNIIHMYCIKYKINSLSRMRNFSIIQVYLHYTPACNYYIGSATKPL